LKRRVPSLVVLKPHSHCVRCRMSTHSACMHVDVRRRSPHVYVRQCTTP